MVQVSLVLVLLGPCALAISITLVFARVTLACCFDNYTCALGIGITMVHVHLVLVLPWYKFPWY